MAQLNPVTPLYSPSVTATNGSDTITVTGSVDCSFVRSGTTVFITGRQPVRAISGTVPNGSGVSTIKLKVAWSYPTTTGELLAINTYEGLADAIFQLSSLVGAAAENSNKVFEFKGGYDLATAGALPPAPASGSAMYRISTSAAVGGRLYRVGETIYYDNIMAMWRSFWDGLGTAAFSNAQTSATDASTPNALMRRGDWGFGEGADSSSTAIDFNSPANTQIVQVASSSTNGATNYSGSAVSLPGAMLLNLQWAGSTTAYQIKWVTDGRRFERQKAGGNWDAQWRDVTAGIGIATTQDINCDTITYGGLYRATSGTLPNGVGAHVIHLNRTKDLQAAQIFIDDDEAGEVSVRNRRGDGVWRARKKLYHNRNILGTVSQSAGVPTGAIIDRGSNANGEYVRYADGTQICWFESGAFYGPTFQDMNAWLSSPLSWNFPAAFATPPKTFYTSGQIDSSVGPGCWPVNAATIATGTTLATSEASIYLYFSQMGGYKAKLKGYAIGRWY